MDCSTALDKAMNWMEWASPPVYPPTEGSVTSTSKHPAASDPVPEDTAAPPTGQEADAMPSWPSLSPLASTHYHHFAGYHAGATPEQHPPGQTVSQRMNSNGNEHANRDITSAQSSPGGRSPCPTVSSATSEMKMRVVYPCEFTGCGLEFDEEHEMKKHFCRTHGVGSSSGRGY